MQKIVIAALAAMSLVSTGTAFADQCAWMPIAQAAAGVAIARNHKFVVSYCEPCGNKKPTASKVHRIGGAAVLPKGSALFAVKINRTEVDLAYTFLSMDGVSFKNAAALARCPASGVSATLRIAPPVRQR